MKKRIHLIRKMAYVVIAALVFTSCQDIDTPAFGEFELDPSVLKINYPLEGAAIKVFDEPAAIDIEVQVDDDNVVNKIIIVLDGTEIATLSDFDNPRHILETYTYDGLVNGEHILTVTSTDVNGVSTTAEVNFTKELPYTPTFEGEILYMPFDGDYLDLITGVASDEVGTPNFSGAGFAGTNAYKGTIDSYLNFPSADLLNDEISAVFWYKASGDPDRAGLLVIGDNADDRNQGFRLFREGSAEEQRIKLNVGTGTGDSWNDGGVINVTAGQWVHVAFTISQTEHKIYLDGVEMNAGTLPAPIDWTGVGPLTIGSGGDTFSYWGHKSDNSDIDELRIFDRALSQEDIQAMIGDLNPYISQYSGESFYMPFDSSFVNLVENASATSVGSPQITEEVRFAGAGSYAGATDAYLTYPSEGLTSTEFSASMWYKLNSDPDRAGILVAGPEDTGNGGYPDVQNLRSNGFRFFRENGADGFQRFKLNVGQGAGDAWVDGGENADVDSTTEDWVHLAFTISTTNAIVYIDGVEVANSGITGIDWTGCDTFSIMSGTPRFTEWGHFSDNSNLDDLRFFNKALSAEEVAAVFGGEVTPPFFGANLYMPFETDYKNRSNNESPTVVGTPSLSGEGKVGSDSYAGATDSYLTFPTTDLTGESFSAAMWYKLNTDPDRAGILVAGPEDTGNGGYPDVQNLRTHGFRFFRENGEDGFQRFKLNVGNGSGDAWIDGGIGADVANDAGWVHLAFTISPTTARVYIDGEIVKEDAGITGIDWTGCDVLSIMSGAPRFNEWGHSSDLSYLDELYTFNRELTQEEIQTIMAE